MEKLTIQQKARAYDEAVCKMKEIITMDNTLTIPREIGEYLFPELKESEDEKIRKELIEKVKETPACIGFNDKNAVLAWLEKQSTPQVRTGLEWLNTIDDACDKRYAEEYAHGEYCHEQSFKWGFQEGIDWLEKQGEPTDINPSEFDLRLNKLLKQFETLPKEELASSLSFYLNVVQNDGTYKREEKEGEQPRYSIGDVLCDKSCTTLNKDAQSNFEITDIRNGMYICDKCSFPISQQNEYELVAKKIEQKPAEWSEEDEYMLDETIQHLKQLIRIDKAKHCACDVQYYQRDIDWLKSLRPQKQWKPTKEQVEAIRIAAEVGTANDSWAMDILKKLYNQLKLELKGVHNNEKEEI